MKRLLLGSVLLLSITVFSGCSIKIPSKIGITCIGCEGLPDCVPGPYGSCPSVVK